MRHTTDPLNAGAVIRAQLEAHITTAARRLGDALLDHPAAEDADELLHSLAKEGVGRIRQPPLAAQAVMSVLRRRNYSLAHVTRLVERDPVLAQTLLRHANSTWYASPRSAPVVSIGTAVQRIGATGVHSAVVSTTISGELLRPGGGYNHMAKEIWNHMVRVAPLSRCLAPAFSIDSDVAFTLGLTHDVGKLVVLDRIGELRRRWRREPRFPNRFVETCLRALHADLGAMASLEWGLEPAFAKAIAAHHREPPPDAADSLSEVVFLAEKVDLCMIRNAEPDLEAIWALGELTGEIEAARSALPNHPAEAPTRSGPTAATK